MKKQLIHVTKQFIIYSPLAGILGASLLNITAFQRQLLLLFVFIWMNIFFLYRSWLN